MEKPENAASQFNSVIITGLVATLLTGGVSVGVSWVTWGQDAVDEDKVVSLILSHAPYVKDQKFIMEAQKRNTEGISQLTEQVGELVKVQTKISTQMDMLIRINNPNNYVQQ